MMSVYAEYFDKNNGSEKFNQLRIPIAKTVPEEAYLRNFPDGPISQGKRPKRTEKPVWIAGRIFINRIFQYKIIECILRHVCIWIVGQVRNDGKGCLLRKLGNEDQEML